MSSSFRCAKCLDPFTNEEIIINSGNEVWHKSCFACSQCFRSFGADEEYYEFGDRKYCEHDFKTLFAPKCTACKENIVKGRIIKALNLSFHPDCFCCGICKIVLTDQGFIRNGNIATCHKCNQKIKTGNCGKAICAECNDLVNESEMLRFQERTYHAYHFNCNHCGIELNKDARERKGELYCLRCNDKMGVSVCAACHKPIEVDRERAVTALGKQWHVDHFMCARCEKPFYGSRHYEKKGLAYCQIHYLQLYGNQCFVCSKTITGDSVEAFNKTYCKEHFACSFCDSKFYEKDKFYDVDLRPCCKKCFDKFPNELRKRLKKYYEGRKK